MDSFGLPLLDQSMSPGIDISIIGEQAQNVSLSFSGVVLTPPPPATPTLLDFSVSPSHLLNYGKTYFYVHPIILLILQCL